MKRKWKPKDGFGLSSEQVKWVKENEPFMVFDSIPLWVKKLMLLGIYHRVSRYSVKLTKRGESIKYGELDDTNSSYS
jgi:hypothetical protein